MADKNEGGAARGAAVSDADVRVLDDLLAAAAVEPPANPADPFNHYLTDVLVELQQRPSVRALLVRLTPLLLPDANERREIAAAADPRVRAAWSDPFTHGYEWWHADGRDRAAYLRRRRQVAVLLRVLAERAKPEPWLPIDVAAKQAGWPLNRAGRCDRARRAAKWTRQPKLPTKEVDGQLCARVSDCIAWKPWAERSAAKYARVVTLAATKPRKTTQR